MIRTIPMQAHAPRRPHAIPTRSPARTVSRALGALAAALCAALLCAALVGYGIARAAAPAQIPAAGPLTGAAAAPAAPASVLARLQALPAGQRAAALSAHLVERALQVLGLEAGTPVDPKRPLKDLGLDSLMAVELRNALTRSIGRPLSATLLFDYPTLGALAAHLMRVLELEEAATAPAAAAPAADPDLHDLSDEEAEALLLQELRSSR